MGPAFAPAIPKLLLGGGLCCGARIASRTLRFDGRGTSFASLQSPPEQTG